MIIHIRLDELFGTFKISKKLMPGDLIFSTMPVTEDSLEDYYASIQTLSHRSHSLKHRICVQSDEKCREPQMGL
jgi:hypothetical protein